MDKIERMKELIPVLQEASKAYYQEDREIMSNFEYDKLYDELENLEKETGVTLAGSPTVSVGYEALDELPKEAHETPMLSLDKTKDVEALRDFIGDHKTLLSWKLDGLTIVLTYGDGKLQKAVTRGNGVVGEVITNNARVFKNIPLQISFKGDLVLRGEAIINYSDFEKINEEIEDVDARYKNPRNLCSGSVRQLNNEITARRNVHFYAFFLVRAQGVDFQNSREKQFQWLKEQGFEVVEYRSVTRDTLDEAMEYFIRQTLTVQRAQGGDQRLLHGKRGKIHCKLRIKHSCLALVLVRTAFIRVQIRYDLLFQFLYLSPVIKLHLCQPCHGRRPARPCLFFQQHRIFRIFFSGSLQLGMDLVLSSPLAGPYPALQLTVLLFHLI